MPSRNGQFTDNLIAFRSDEMTVPVNIGPDTAPETFTLARNAWYCLDDPAQSRPRLPIPEERRRVWRRARGSGTPSRATCGCDRTARSAEAGLGGMSRSALEAEGKGRPDVSDAVRVLSRRR